MVQLEHFTHGGYDLAYETFGAGDRVVVLMHGLLLDRHLNRGLAMGLAEQGNRVVLLDLLGHGGSARPRHASAHRMDAYSRQVIALLDELGIEQAVVGGVSLGANVTLHAAAQSPSRVRAMLIEMPVLEWAAPAAAMVFVPLLLAAHYGQRPFRMFTSLMRRLPRTGVGVVDSFMNAISSDPEEIAAVLHGILVGPVAPELEARHQLHQPALIIAHGRDLVHPFSDAVNLSEQLPDARLIEARSALELRITPTRLTRAIGDFLDEVWGAPAQVASIRSDA